SARTPSRKQTILRAIFPFTDVPAYDLPVYASQCHTGHHARLGTQLPAKLCRGHHFSRLNSMSFQGATPHRSVRARRRIRLPPWMSSEKANRRIGMQNVWATALAPYSAAAESTLCRVGSHATARRFERPALGEGCGRDETHTRSL